MIAPPVFTDEDMAELRRMNARLAFAPRVRMKTWASRRISHLVVLLLETFYSKGVGKTGVTVETRSIIALGKRISIRILRPPGKLRGVHLDIHGGGWCAGNAKMNDQPNAALAAACQVAVVSVEYGRAPECSIHELIDQCEAVAVWLSENVAREFKADRMTIGGDSAGAHLAACVLLRRPRRFRAALLWYGVYDLAGSKGLREAPRNALVFHAPTMLACLRLLTPHMSDEERRAGDISPLFADLKGMPPALLISGMKDPLHTESVQLYAKWRAAGADTRLLEVPEAGHAFNRLHIELSRKTEGYAHAWLSNYFSAVSQ
ncbi:esterase [Terrihabitans soli]|uniref:Esterase n=1 Tax=Terrihabitans soli TaxID=708113 RepID=A0A6S6QTF2_9HYPH|nr:alpha/beta hydrolase [Terrihabitans soli]BCJ89728.1 esterase [Terrihabitans soli]